MAFVRIKKIKGKEYAYLVENKWQQGKVRQKTIKYLGKVNNFKTKKVSSFDEGLAMQSLIENSLKLAGFDDNLKLNGLTVDLIKQKVFLNKKETAIKLNDGFLSSNSLKKLLNYNAQEEITQGMKLAKTLQETGIEVTQECFIKLYKVLHAD